MVDVISARFQDAFETWRNTPTNVPTGGENTRPEERISTNQLRRVGDEHRRRKNYIRDLEKQVSQPVVHFTACMTFFLICFLFCSYTFFIYPLFNAYSPFPE